MLLFNRDAIMKDDPDKPRKMRSKSQEGDDDSPASPVTDVSLICSRYQSAFLFPVKTHHISVKRLFGILNEITVFLCFNSFIYYFYFVAVEEALL